MKIKSLGAALLAACSLSALAPAVAGATAGPPDVIGLVKCVGDSLAGNACHG